MPDSSRFQPQTTRRLGNAAKRVADTSPGPWEKWTETVRYLRAIRFIETYCRPAKGYGAGEPMVLADFQKGCLEEVLADGVRAGAMSVARGNGKSTFLAAVATWALFDPDEGGAPQVPVVATTLMQAFRAVYGVALEMILGEPELADRSQIYSGVGTQRVKVPSTRGEMFPVSNEPDGLQGLDPSFAICDEMGFMPAESWNALVLASGKRPRSLVMGIGTPGYDRDNALWMLRNRAAEGRLRSHFKFIEYAADEGCELEDVDQWRKANPAMEAGYLDEAAMWTALEAAPNEAAFRIFKLGQWVDGVDCWLGGDGRALWESLEDPFELEPGAPTWGGIDVALKKDSTAVVLGQRRSDGRLHAHHKLWIPTKDEAIDVTDVMQYLREAHERFDLVEVSFDPRFFDVPAKMLCDEGLPMVEIPQSVERMTPAVGSAFEMIRAKGLTHDGDPVVAGQILNAMSRFNERGFTLAKAKSRGKIDAAIALVLMVDRALRFDPPEVGGSQVFFG